MGIIMEKCKYNSILVIKWQYFQVLPGTIPSYTIFLLLVERNTVSYMLLLFLIINFTW